MKQAPNEEDGKTSLSHRNEHMKTADSQKTRQNFFNEWCEACDRFLFAPRTGETLAVIRFATGMMAAYTHAIWLLGSASLLGPNAWLGPETIQRLQANTFKWSYLTHIESLGLIQLHEIVAILASLCVACGLFARITGPLAWWMTLMVCHRATPHTFGLDQILIYLLMYLMVSDAAGIWSVDARLRKRWKSAIGWLFPPDGPTVKNNLATRLMQCHLCVIYLFGGLSKLRGDLWWDGSALWFAVASYEYQSINATWLGKSPFLISCLTHLTLAWETFYIAIVWPRLTRPIALGIAVGVHAGIGLFLGMVTFGTIMIVANLAFIEPHQIRRIASTISRKNTG